MHATSTRIQTEHVARRLFLVGASRSGTTLLQVLLASHPSIHTFPETAFFISAVGRGRRRLLAELGLTTGKEYRIVERFLKRIAREDLLSTYPRRPFLFRTAVDGFVRLLDRLTVEASKEIWVEKTPRHFRYIGMIRRFVPSSQVVHMIRDGRDVVASIYHRAVSFPDEFGRQRHLSYGIDLWNRAIEASIQYLGKPNHVYVVYEQLVAQPRRVLRHVCGEIGIAYDPHMLSTTQQTAHRALLSREAWKANVTKMPEPRPSKFQQLFDHETQRKISSSLNLRAYDEIKAALSYV